MPQILLILALNIAGLFAVYFLLRARIRRFLELENLLGEVRAESRALVMELNETAERNVSLVEDRIGALRSLLEEVDRRIGVAHRELENRSAEKAVYEQLSRRRPIVPRAGGPDLFPSEPPAAPPFAEAAAARAPSPAEAAAGAGAQGRQAGASASPSMAGPLPQQSLAAAVGQAGAIPLVLGASAEGLGQSQIPEIRFSRDSVVPRPTRNEEALELHRKGFSPDIIAARLGATVAEIELLVEMEERRSESFVPEAGFSDGSEA